MTAATRQRRTGESYCLEAALGMLVIDPTQAAVAMVLAAVGLGPGAGRKRAAEWRRRSDATATM